MSLTSWSGNIVRKSDIIIAKNYLTTDEIDTLNRLATSFLESAELRVKMRKDLMLPIGALPSTSSLKTTASPSSTIVAVTPARRCAAPSQTDTYGKFDAAASKPTPSRLMATTSPSSNVRLYGSRDAGGEMRW